MIPELLNQNHLVIAQTKTFITDEFTIHDGSGRQVGAIMQNSSLSDFFLRASRGVTVTTTDIDGNPLEPLLTVEDPFNLLHDQYEVYQHGREEPIAHVRKEWTWFRPKFTVQLAGFPDVEINGDIWDMQFELTSADRPIARVATSWRGFGDLFMGKNTYHLHFVDRLDPQQHATILGTVMCLDMVRTKKRQND